MARITKAVVSFFIFFHILVMVTSGLPDRSAIGKNLLKELQWYQIFFGLDQTWSMFAPNPTAVNSYLDAVITFKDGSTERWTFPRSSQMDDWDRFTGGERFRKYQQENLRSLEKTEMWFDLGRFLEREINLIEKTGQGRTFESVQFYRHSNTVKPPTVIFVEHGRLSSEFQSEAVFQYKATEKVRYEAQSSN